MKIKSLSTYWLFFVCFALFCTACSEYKKPTVNDIVNLTVKPKKNYTKTSGALVINNPNEKEIQLLEIYADIFVDGKDIGSFLKKTDALINPQQKISIGFYNETNNTQIGDVSGVVNVKCKGYIKGKINNENITNSFEVEKSVIVGAKTSGDDLEKSAEEMKQLKKEQKKMEKQMKKNEKDKRKMQDQAES
jgi:hypothetical protein